MKVLLVNGSPHEKGCTNRALEEVAKTLREEGIETSIFWIDKKPLPGCMDCQGCGRSGRCVFNDKVNEFKDLAENADGFIFGSPVHYASVGGAMRCFMDRLFYSGGAHFYLKPAAAVISARRAGTTAAFDQLNKYFTISQMPVISSCYWNMVHGAEPAEVEKDAEGLQVMRTLGRNMAWFLRCKEAAQKAGVQPPKQEERVWTNFIED
jgi:multimeric flavodoxin WrbA